MDNWHSSDIGIGQILSSIAEETLPLADLPNKDPVEIKNALAGDGTTIDKLIHDRVVQETERLNDGAERTTFVAYESHRNHLDWAVGTGSVIIGPDKDPPEACIYSFYVEKDYQGANVATTLLRACFEEIGRYENEHKIEITKIVAGRYDITEQNNPFFTRLVSMLGRYRHVDQYGKLVDPDDIISIEPFNWKGEPGKFYIFDRQIAEELLVELSGKLPNLW